MLDANYCVFNGYQVDEEGIAKKDEEGNYLKLEQLLKAYTKDLEDPEIKQKVLDEQVGKIEEMDILLATEIIDTSILAPIQDNVDKFTTEVSTQYTKEKEQLGKYSEAVVSYDPLLYIDHEEIQGITTAMFDNGTKLYEAIMTTDLQQAEYVADVYEATRTDLSTMQDNVAIAKEDSDKAVADGLADLKAVKNANSAENQQILLDFSQKLPYTKLGSLEYRQAYEFMINPISYQYMEENEKKEQAIQKDSVTQESDSVNVNLSSKKDLDIIVMIIIGMICVIIVISTIKYHIHKKEEPF